MKVYLVIEYTGWDDHSRVVAAFDTWDKAADWISAYAKDTGITHNIDEMEVK